MRAGMIGLALLLTGLVALSLWAGLTSQVGQVNDDLMYLTAGKALATGQGYYMIGEPGSPALVLYPPIYPALLALGWLFAPMFPANLFVFKTLNIVCFLASAWLTYPLARRYGLTSIQAGIAAAIVLFSSYGATFADMTMSEPLFTLVLLAVLLRLESWTEPPARPEETAPAGQSAIAPVAMAAMVVGLMMIRAIGLTLLLALLLRLAALKRYRQALILLLASGIFYAPWALWCASVKPEAATTGYIEWMLANSDHLREVGLYLSGVWERAYSAAIWGLPIGVSSFLDHPRLSDAVRHTLGASITVVMLVGFVRIARAQGGWRLLHLFLAVYTILLLNFPWDPGRYLISLTPLLAIGLVAGAWWPLTHLAPETTVSSPRYRTWARLLASAFLVAVLFNSLAGARRPFKIVSAPAWHDALLYGPYSQEQQELKAMLEWGRQNLEPEAIWVYYRPLLLYLYTDRQAVAYQDGPDPAPATNHLFASRPTFMVLTPNTWEFPTTCQAFVAAHPDRVQRAYRSPHGTFEVYRVDGQDAGGDRPPQK